MKTKARAYTVLAATMVAACAGPRGGSLPSLVNPRPAAPAAVAPGADATSEQLAVVPRGTFGPYLGDRAEGTLAVWAPEISGKRKWTTAPVHPNAGPHADPKPVADAPAEIDLVAVRPVGGANSAGFVVLSSSPEFSGARIDVFALGLHGELAGGPTPLVTGIGDVMWIDAVPTESGVVALWAVRRDDRADLYGVELGPSGDAREQPAKLIEGARAWQVTKVSGGAAMAVLSAGPARGTSGPLRVVYIDNEGHLERKSTFVTDGATVEADLDMATIGDRIALAWSDRREVDARLYGAVVDAKGSLVKPPAPLGPPFGPQAVLRLAPTTGNAVLAWENLLERRAGARMLHLGSFGGDGTFGAANTALYMATPDGAPELAATTAGIGILTLAPACVKGQPCDSTRSVPTFVELDASLGVVSSSPVLIEHDQADLVWGLTCKDTCVSLAAGTANPAPVYGVKLGGSRGAWQPAAWRESTSAPPRVASLEAIGKSDPVAELATARTETGTLASWITYFDPSTPFTRSSTKAPDGKYEPTRALLQVRALPDQGPTPEPVVLSYRAHSPGGVAATPGEANTGNTVVAWAGIDDHKPEVFLTLVSAAGEKLSQKMITHGKTGVSDIAVVRVDDGFVVSWVDEHAGAAEVRVTKVDRALKTVVPERRVGPATSSPSGIQLLAQGDHVVLAWSDARGEGPKSAAADVFVIRLATKDLSPLGPERVVAETPEHSRSPSLAAFGEGAVIAWIEDPIVGSAASGSSVMIARLDSGAEPVPGSVGRIDLHGSPEGVGLFCSADSCRVAVTASTADGGDVEGFVWRPEGEVEPKRLVVLDAAPRDAVAPSVADRSVIYADENQSHQTIVRRLTADWQ